MAEDGVGPNRWTALVGSEVGIGQCTVPGWPGLRLGRRVITPSRRHYAQPLRLVSAGVLLAGRR